MFANLCRPSSSRLHKTSQLIRRSAHSQRVRHSSRTNSTFAQAQASSRKASSANSTPSTSHVDETTQYDEITPEQLALIHEAIRVDQAGELAANWIYAGQAAVLGHDKRVGPVIQEMWDQEKHHLATMNRLQLEHGVRPTALWEVAKVAGYGLGVVSALMSKEAAMAATEAVETEIGEHYNDQLKALAVKPTSHPDIKHFANLVEEFRDDELEHLDTAVAHHAQRAPAHALFSAVVGAGCRVAIELCKRI